jgi:peroxidase
LCPSLFCFPPTWPATHSCVFPGFLGQRLRCCGVNLHEFHPECYPIRLPDTDPVNGQINIKCQEYVRSGTAPRVGCTLGPREQINQVTSFMDGSTIYGSSVEEANDLRLFRAGLMKTQPGPVGTTKGLLPPDDNVIDCNTKNKDVK